jgi:tetratricopeptide (TPR) repeat protein
MVGRKVSHYEIQGRIGSGGMGVVYKAWDPSLRHEAQAISALDHPNICNIHEIDHTTSGQLFICMAYYPGESLARKLAKTALPVDESLRIVRKVADGLDHAHRHGIVHRDIKPANIIITDENEVKIVDFGLAKLAGRTRVTRPGKTMGTIAYMSPEQARGDETDSHTDIFSLGTVLFELLTGRLPFDADHETAILYKITHEDPPPLSDLVQHGVARALQPVLDRALARDVSKRYGTARHMGDDLRRISGGGGWRLPLWRLGRAAAVGVAIFAAAAVAVGLMMTPPVKDFVSRRLGMDAYGAALHVAVLPIENLGDDPRRQAVCDGLMETLTSKLTQLEQFHDAMWVVPASEVRKRGVTGPSEARQMFGVNMVIVGSLQQIEDDFRLALNLVDVSSPAARQLRSYIIDDNVANLAALQDETVIRMAALLDIEMTPDSKEVLTAGGTADSEAYTLYLEGLGHVARYDQIEEINVAINAFEAATARDPGFALAYARLAHALWRKFQLTDDVQWLDDAVANCERAAELNDLIAPVHVTLGQVCIDTGQYDRAEQAFRRALALDASSSSGFGGLARLYAVSERMDEAETMYRKAIMLKPDYWGGYNSLALFYYRLGRQEDAIEQMQHVVRLTPDNPWGYNNLGAMYYAADRWDEAGEMFARSFAVHPNYRAASNAATLHYIQGRYAEAAAMYEHSLEINNTSHITWANLANAYYWIEGRRNEAIETYRRAIELAEAQHAANPRSAELIADLATYYVMLAENDKARSLAQEALEIAPSNVYVIYDAGYTYEQIGERDSALVWIGKAVENGYPKSEIARDPWLADLRKDDRFAAIMKGEE